MYVLACCPELWPLLHFYLGVGGGGRGSLGAATTPETENSTVSNSVWSAWESIAAVNAFVYFYFCVDNPLPPTCRPLDALHILASNHQIAA